MSFYEIHDPAFAAFVLHNAPVKRLATGFDWAEGPVWFGDQNCLLFSDIPNNRIVRWSEDGTTTFRAPANYTNGQPRPLRHVGGRDLRHGLPQRPGFQPGRTPALRRRHRPHVPERPPAHPRLRHGGGPTDQLPHLPHHRQGLRRRSAGDGVHCIAPDGRLLGKILVPEVVSNICFGGRAKHRLFITATTSLYSVILNRKGV
jgi:hypothetical protein